MVVPEGLLMELGPATGAKWNFVLGHLQPVLGEQSAGARTERCVSSCDS